MTAKEYLQGKYEWHKKHWNEHEHVDDEFTASEMEAYHQAKLKLLDIPIVSQRSELLKALGKEIDIDLVSGKKCRILKTVEESYLIQENGNKQIRWVGVSEIKTKSL